MDTYAGAVMLIANPAAQNGRGALAARRALGYMRLHLGKDAVVFKQTTGPGHAFDIARAAYGCSTVLALGGDGIAHEVANGLMQRPKDNRPDFGVIALGSGNDYARTLGISFDVEKACEQLLCASSKPSDVGWVNGHYFLETLSFGVDAAIALDTVNRRQKTGHTGTLLYIESGFDQLFHHLETYDYQALYDGVSKQTGRSVTFAVQVGPYYGSGFKICPDARIDDGLFDVCIAHPPVDVARALLIFLCAKMGKHTGFRQMQLRRCRTLHVEFADALPAQMDGERIEGSVFDVVMHPQELNVLRPV